MPPSLRDPIHGVICPGNYQTPQSPFCSPAGLASALLCSAETEALFSAGGDLRGGSRNGVRHIDLEKAMLAFVGGKR